jgi:hypothetical protein
LIYCIGSCRLGEANRVFNGMEVVTSCRPAASLACATWHWVVGPLDTIAARLPRVAEPPHTVAIHHEWAAGLRYTVAILQSPCSHGLVLWRLGRYAHTLMRDHDGYAVRGYLFTVIAHNP